MLHGTKQNIQIVINLRRKLTIYGKQLGNEVTTSL